MDFFGIGFGELLLILVVALIIVGPAKIVSVARDLGKIAHNLRKASSEISYQLTRAVEEEGKNPGQKSPDKNNILTPPEQKSQSKDV